MQKKLDNPNTTPIVVDEVRYKLRAAIDTFYDLQKLRIQVGNRLCASFKYGSDDSNEDDKFIMVLIGEYDRVTDTLVEQFDNNSRRLLKAIKATDNLEYIKSAFDYSLVEQYKSLREQEDETNKLISKLVKEHPMWDRFFVDVKGCGTTMAAICIAYLDIHKARYVSSFWSYSGVGTRTTEDGSVVAMSRKSTIEVEYVDSEGNIKTKKSIGYNEFLHTKLLGVLGDSFVKQGDVYRKVYDDYKNRYLNKPDWQTQKGALRLRAHRAAIRQVIKAFLRDLWVEWRTYEGYEIPLSYAEAHLGMAPHGYNEADGRPIENQNSV